MRTLEIDIETFSSVDLAKSGVYRYCESPDFEMLLFACSVDGGEVKVIDIAQGEKLPNEILEALTDDSVEKWSFNASFERICLSKYLGLPSGKYLESGSWYCTMVWSAYLGLPFSLEKVGRVLGLEKQKLGEGKNLIRYFSMPCKPTKANGGRSRNMPKHDSAKWSEFINYNKQDVEVEIAIKERLSHFPLPANEWANYHLDQKINDRGVRIDTNLVNKAILFDEKLREENMTKAIKLTGLENPNSPLQLKEWLNSQGLEIESLAKKEVEDALKTATGHVKEALELRQELSKSSVKKYASMENVKGQDNRARGLFQFYGANRTGRWCLAEDTLILVKTNNGIVIEKSIQDVSLEDRVWDGDSWVEHEGVVFSGDKEVITWDGVTATPEHVVYISDIKSITLKEAKERRLPLWRGNTPSIN